MAAAWLDELPRQQAVPLPTPMHTAARAHSKSAREETLKALREKLGEYQAENNLLGTLVRELKAEKDGLQKKLSCATKQQTDASNRAATALQQADAVSRDQKRLTAEVERLSSVVHSHAVRLHKAKQHQQELEDVALDLRAELDEARGKQEAAEQAAAASAQRAVAAEAKLEAAGLGAMPKMGPTAEQLVINSTQRIRELTEELAALRTEQQQQAADAQERLQQQDQQWQHKEQQWQQELEQAKSSGQKDHQQLDQRLQQQMMELQQQYRHAQESDQQCKDLQQQVVSLQQALMEAKRSAEAYMELQRVQQTTARLSQSMQQQVTQLQQQLADRNAAHNALLAEHQEQTAALQREKQELVASLAALQQHDSGHRLTAADAASKVERLRGELLRCVGELQAQLASAATAGQQQQQVQQQLRALEATAAAAREEAAETRQQLVELASVSLSELREQVAGEAAIITGLPDDLDAADLPTPVTTYIKVLEHAVCDCEQRSKQLLADALAAQQHEREARQVLAAAREAQGAAERALQQQTQRLLAAERMRLSDLKEQQSLERRLALAQQECANLRDALLNRANGIGWQQQQQQHLQHRRPLSASPAAGGCVPQAAAAASAAEGHAAAGGNPNSPNSWAAGFASGSVNNNNSPTAAAGDGHVNVQTGASSCGSDPAAPAEPQQRHKQQQLQEETAWRTPAADAAGQTSGPPDVSAHSAASINRYQAKLAQLRQMKEQLMHRATAGKAPAKTKQQQQQQEQPAGQVHVPAADTCVWTPRAAAAADDCWLIGCGQLQQQQQHPPLASNSSGQPSIDLNSTGGFSNGGADSMVHSSSGGGSSSCHISSWSSYGRAGAGAGAGGASADGSKPLAGHTVGLSRLGATAAGGGGGQTGGLYASSCMTGGATHHTGQQAEAVQQQQEAAAALVASGSMHACERASLADTAAAAAADTAAVARSSAGRSRHSSSSGSRDRSRQRPVEAGSVPAKELIGSGGGGGGGGCSPSSPSAAHGLNSRSSHLQRWAQPKGREQQQQQARLRTSGSSRRV